MSRVPVDSVVCKSMMFSNVIVDITISCRSFVLSQSCVQVPASLSNVVGLAVGALDLVNRALPVVKFLLMTKLQPLTDKSRCKLQSTNDFIGLFQKKSTPPRRMACWKFSREGGLRALEIWAGGGV